jgi:hypothetical protein
MGALENFECPPVCVRTLTGTHVGHNRRTLPQDSSARMAGRGRVRGLKFEVFGTSNPEFRTSDHAFFACLALHASRSVALTNCFSILLRLRSSDHQREVA